MASVTWRGTAGNDRMDVMPGTAVSSTQTIQLGDTVNVLAGGGDDTIVGSSYSFEGTIIANGSVGLDTISLISDKLGRVIDLAVTGLQNTGEGVWIAVSSIERAIGSIHDDILSGTNNSDTLNGHWGSDTLFGRGGDDVLDPGEFFGDNLLDGGDGWDTARAGAPLGAYDIWYQDGFWRFAINEPNQQRYGTVTFNTVNVEEVTFGTVRWQPKLFYDQSNVVDFNALTAVQKSCIDLGSGLYDAGRGNDAVNLPNIDNYLALQWDRKVQFKGGLGNDTINGGDGDDKINGGNGADSLTAGSSGRDHLIGGADNDSLFGGQGSDVLEGGKGNDSLYAGYVGTQILNGGSGNDRLVLYDVGGLAIGGRGDDTLQGEDGDDTLYGGAGADYLQGGFGFDVADFDGKAKDYTITRFGVSDIYVTHIEDGVVDRLSAVDQAVFADRVVDLLTV